MEKKELKRYIIIAFLVIAVCLVIKNFGLFAKLLGVLFAAVYPLLLGAVIAYIFNIILSGLEKRYFPNTTSKGIKKVRRPVCIVLSFLIVFAMISLILKIVIPELISAFKLIFEEIPPLIDKLSNYAFKMLEEYPDIQKEAMALYNEFDVKSLDWASITEKAAGLLKTGVMGIISSAVGIVGSLTGTITNIVIAIIFAIYLLARKDKLLSDTNRFQTILFKESTNHKVNKVCKTANDTFKSFFIGQFFEAILLGCFCFIGMKILQLPYAAMSGVLVGVTALIPIVGAFLGAGISAFIICTENPMQALIFIIFLVILQQLEGNIVYPKVVGDSIGLPGIWVLAAVTVGGGLGGIMGMLIGVPCAATAYKLLFEHLEKKEISRGIKQIEEKAETNQQKKILNFKTKKDTEKNTKNSKSGEKTKNSKK
ncbi:MAG: AI-2E family transporter [Ruminococcus sp.]|nr:AI-2E family transporter [Ruminococcus sp.]